jgi:hypothetical protein
MLTIITGPPCAGKSTYLQQHARPGDIIIDFDRLAQALGSPVTHGHGEHIWKVTIEARDTAITTAVRCHARGARAWIVDSKPPSSRRSWYESQGARFADLTAPAAELHRRATQAGRPACVHDLIDQWLAGQPLPQGRPAWAPRPPHRSPSPAPRTRW